MAQIQYLSHFFSGLDGSRTYLRITIVPIFTIYSRLLV
nr:MAG TPA: hypothetical protein [Caudoviricetes sp.]